MSLRSGSIDFLEFLNMMTMAKNHDGPFKALDSQLVTTLAKLDRGDLLLLLTVLKVPNSRLDGIS
ncbi:Actin, partial [Symbiodinium sp. CCMP2456]